MNTIRISNRQFSMLKTIQKERLLGLDEARGYDQRTFRALLVRGWLAYRPSARCFGLTQAGAEAWANFLYTDISRANPSLPLTRYFDPTAYGLHAVKKAAA